MDTAPRPARPGHSGTGDLDHLAQNVAAGSLRLSEGELAVLDALHHAHATA
ncbi:hypothetical protein [Streptomyces sp. NBC_00012]|uniref:hypothetical protein n=1 Tax=Streptomyces sp. NBC_00012 TaxID=2975621 RepID=UPI00386BA1EC